MEIVKGKIGNALESVAPDHILGVAADIYDESRQQYQSTINETVGDYIEYPEFVRAVTDNEDKVLYGVQKDGNFYFGAGCPPQVKEYVQQQIDIIMGQGDITEKIDTINEMIAFFDQISHDENLKHLLDGLDAKITAEKERAETAEQALNNTKVDKEEGKSLIPIQYIQEVENPEFVYVKTDAKDKILWAIKTDGSIYYGAGVPQQVIDYINEKIAELSLDEYEDIVAFLNNLEKDDKTLQDLLDEKVDKEDGKSLIDEEYANGVHYIENPEFVEVKVDSENRILEAVYKDGTKLLPAGVRVNGAVEHVGATITTIDNPEFVGVWFDASDHILMAIKTDGDIYYGCGVPSQIKTYIEEKIAYLSLDEYEDIVAFLDEIINKRPIFSNKKVSIIGDSISTFAGYIPDGYPSWYPHENDRSSDVVSVNDTWWKKLIDATNSTLEVNTSYSGSTASSIVEGFSPRVTLLGNPDVILVALGTNDSGRSIPIGDVDFDAKSYDLTQFASAYIKGIKDTIASYPYARIICLAFDMRTEYRNAIKTIADHYNLEYIYVGDISVVHPNKAEMQAVYEKIYDTYTLSGLLANKVDKEDGKSLIDSEFAEGVSQIENPEFAEVHTDAEDKILYGVKKGGDFYFGAGVPSQVQDELDNKADLDALDEVAAEVAEVADNKVGKEEGKSLIDAEYASSIQFIDNPEFMDVELDSENKILEGIQIDGTKVFGGDVKVLGSIDISGVNYKVVSNPEWFKVILDAEDRIICGIKTDGKFVVYVADFLDDIEAIKERLKELDAYSVTENPEFMDVELDADDKVLGGRKVDGTKFENNDVELNCNATVAGSLEVDGVVIKNSEDPENRNEITLDAEAKIISYRKDDGTLVENVGIESPKITTDSLNLSKNGMTEFQQALKDSGFRPGGGGDWSEREVIELPEPASYALLNLIVDSLPINNSDVSEGYAEYYDKAGNYFKLPVSLEAQGQTSRIFARTGGKGNYTADFPTDIKFGSWVPQDSFHLKGCAKDVIRGILPTSYKWAYMFMEYLDAKPNRVLLEDTSKTTTTHASGDRFTDWGDGARCLPDGFPVEVYINGEYWGLYSWQLKKHRKNYSMDKKDYTSLFLDADNFSNFWLGDIPWNKIDIKGPKDLVCMDGSAFDGDNPKELIDDTSEYYDDSDKKDKGSATTKAIIKTFPAKYLEVKALADAGTSEALAEAKTLFAEYFDVNACMLVYVYNCLMKNNDSIYKNTLWGTWKNGKIAPMLWDLDGMYGEGWIGNKAIAPSAYLWTGSYATSPWPLALFWSLYQTEIGTTYENLRRDGVISIQTWHSIMSAWIGRIGVECYKRDIAKWPETPSYRENYTNSDYWEERTTTNNIGNIQLWDSENSYNQGDEVALRTWPEYDWYIIYTAKQASDAVNPQCPVTRFYEKFPLIGGYYNSLTRMRKWMEEQIALCDSIFSYNQ